MYEAINLLSEDVTNEPRIQLNKCIALALVDKSPEETAEMFTTITSFSEPKAECRRLYWTIRTLAESGQRDRAKPYATDALAFASSDQQLKDEFILPLVSIAADILQNEAVLKAKIKSYPKGKILSPYPHLILARMSFVSDSRFDCSKEFYFTDLEAFTFF